MSHVLLMTYYLFGLVQNFTVQIIEGEFVVVLFVVAVVVCFFQDSGCGTSASKKKTEQTYMTPTRLRADN